MILLRSIIDAEDARKIDFVNLVVEHDQLHVKTRECALIFASLSPLAVRPEQELFLLQTQNKYFDEKLALRSALAALAVTSPEVKDLLERLTTKGEGK